MIFFLLLVLCFVVMMIFPFTVGFVSLRGYAGERPLTVKNDNVRDPRYFSKSFVEKMEQALKQQKGDTIRLSREEKILDGELAQQMREVDRLVVAEGKLFTMEEATFQKEILVRQYAGIGEKNRLRAIASLGGLTLEAGCTVERWADAEGAFRIHRNCFLGISASSAERIVIDPGCEFRRLYAPQIIVGEDDKIRCINRCRIYAQEKVSKEILWNIGRVEDESRIDNSIVSTGNLRIGKGAAVYGDVKADKNIRVLKGAVITGNLIADGEITLEENVTVRGIVFSQESIYVGKKNVIGECGMIKSVVARERVVLCDGAVIYGYISGEKTCRTLEEDQYYKEIQDTY